MEDCIFCKIARKEVPSRVEYEDADVLVFHDIHPKAPLHLLIVPKKHIPSVDHVMPEDKTLMGDLILIAKKVALEKNLKGYKLLINVGKEGGQEVDHLHIHLFSHTAS